MYSRYLATSYKFRCQVQLFVYQKVYNKIMLSWIMAYCNQLFGYFFFFFSSNSVLENLIKQYNIIG